MTEEIKEIEQYLKKCSNCFTCNNFLGEDENGGHCMLRNAYNCITNLQKENELHNKILKDANDVLNIQSQKGNYNYDSYMLGLYNGMEMIVSLFEQKEPKLKSGKDIKFLHEIDYKSRNEKAIEYIKSKKAIINTDYIRIFDLFEIEEQGYTNDLLNILQGGDE